MSTVRARPKWWAVVLAYIVLAAVLVFLGYLLWLFAHLLGSLSPEVAAAIIAAAATVLVSVASLIYTKWWERRSVIEQEHRKQKAQTYSEFMAFFFKTMRSNQTAPMAPEDVAAGFDAFTRELIIWGSGNMLRKYAAFRNEALKGAAINAETNSDPAHVFETQRQQVKTILAFEEMLYAFREDLGQSKSDLKTGELLATFINDLDPNALNMNAPTTPTQPAG